MDETWISIARHYGLEEVRTGYHVIRNERRLRQNEVYVSHLWRVDVIPSFHGKATMTALHFGEHRFHGHGSATSTVHRQQIQGCVTLCEENVVVGPVRLEADNVLPAFRNVNLTPKNDPRCLDGIQYRIWIPLNQIVSALTISNPLDSSLVAVEDAFFKFAKCVQKASASDELKRYLEHWCQYLRRSQKQK